MDCEKVIEYFYPEDTPLRRTLLAHSTQVREKALAIMKSADLPLDATLVAHGAMLHDIGIGECHAPGIFCTGDAHYIAHGLRGAQKLRQYGQMHNINLEALARICERHTGSGLSAEDVRRQKLPIPEQDYLPETPEEKLVCLADKFFSKSGDMQEKTLRHIRRSMEKFGKESVERFDEMCNLFNLQDLP